jgi:TolB-like protein/Tfp pilus assembly protein PilF
MPAEDAPAAYRLDTDRRVLLIDGSPVNLGARAFDVLSYLQSHSDRVVTKAELLEKVWGGLAVEEGNLSVQISTLRKALGPKAIATVPGVGYKLAVGAAKHQTVPDGPDVPDIPSLAVLPFANLTGQTGQDYLVDGIVTDLIGALTKISGLFTIAATSSFVFKGQTVDLSEVGQRLGVRYVLEGAVQQAGDALRISVQLADASSGHTIWSERFQGATADVFDLQDQITEMVCGVIEPTLLEAEANRSAAKPTTDMAAYDLCLQAIPLALKPRDVSEFRKAVELLDQAVALDPEYRLAQAWTCRAFMSARAPRWVSKDEVEAFDPIAEALLRNHRNDALVLAFAGFMRGYLDRDRDGAVRATRLAVKLNPNSVLILNAAAWTEHYVLNHDRAMEHFRRAVRLDPFGHIGSNSRLGWGIAEYLAGRLENAVSVLEESLADDTANAGTIQCLIPAYWHLGREAEARALVPTLLELMPDFSLEREINAISIRDPAVLQQVRDAMEAVGLPE